MALALATHVHILKSLGVRCPETGDAYGLCLVRCPDGTETTVLACATKFNLDYLKHLEGLEVNVIPTSGGLKLRPLNEQPEATVSQMIERLEAGDALPDQAKGPEPVESESPVHQLADNRILPITALSELIATTAEIAVKRGIPMAVWACLPAS